MITSVSEAAPGIKLEVDGSAADVPDWQADLEAPHPPTLLDATPNLKVEDPPHLPRHSCW